MADLFSIGKSGLQAYRQALGVTGQNIANINTDGYKRREAEMEELGVGSAGIYSTGKSTGLGVRVTEINRAFDEFLLNKARNATSNASSANVFSSAMQQIEDIILPGDANLGAAIGRFFTALQEVSSTPSDLTGRTVALEQAKQMTAEFTQLANNLENFKESMARQATNEVAKVNTLTKALSNINIDLSGGKATNSMLDARDGTIDELNKFAQVHVKIDSSNTVEITLGNIDNGPRLLSANKPKTLRVNAAPDRLNFSVTDGVNIISTNQITGGAVEGYASAYAEADGLINKIDDLAFLLTKEINAIHQQGIDLNHSFGKKFFQDLEIVIEKNETNIGDASAEVEIVNFAQISPEKIDFTFDAEKNIWTGINKSGEKVASGRSIVELPGVKIRFNGEASTFDQFSFNPAKGSAKGIAVSIKRPEDIAAASPLLVSADAKNIEDSIFSAKNADVQDTGLNDISQVFGNGISSVNATEFISDGSVAHVPQNVDNLEIFSLAAQSQLSYGISSADLGNADDLTMSIIEIDTSGNQTTQSIVFNLNYDDVNLVSGDWTDASQLSELLNMGTVRGTVVGTSDTKSLAELGAHASGKGGNLNISVANDFFQSGTLSTTSGRLIDGVVSAREEEATEVQVFTREGRHVAGTLASDAQIAAYQSRMTVDNGFSVGAVYVGDYLNLSGQNGYMGIDVQNRVDSQVLIKDKSNEATAIAKFSFLDGVDTNESSHDGLRSSSTEANYSMTVYTDESLSIDGTNHTAIPNEISLTFSEDDDYNLKITFDDKPDSGATSTDDKELTLSNLTLSGGDATSIAQSINHAIAANRYDGDGGSNLSNIVTASASGNVVTLTILDGKGVKIERLDNQLSAGNGTVTINPITLGAPQKVLTDAFGTLTASVDATELSEPTGDAVARKMLEKLRTDAPVAYVRGDVSTALENDSVSIKFENQIYKLTKSSGEMFVSGGEKDRLTAFFDTQNRLNVVSSAGTISRSKIEVYIDNSVPKNVEVAQRFGLMKDLSQVPTEYSDENLSIPEVNVSNTANVVDLTFSADDSYNLTFELDDKRNWGSSETTDKSFSISNAAMNGNDATAIATAINNAISANLSNGGTDLSGVASAAAVGNVVKLTVNDGSSIKIGRNGDKISTGTGTVTVDPVTMNTTTKVLNDAYLGYEFDMQLKGATIVTTPNGSNGVPSLSLSSESIAKQRITLKNLPDEDLIVFVNDGGAQRVTVRYDELPVSPKKFSSDIEVKIIDGETGVVEFIDSATQTSIATRELSQNQASAVGFSIDFYGDLSTGDKFYISGNEDGIGDNRNIQQILDLQTMGLAGNTSGGFQRIFTNAVAHVGAMSQSGKLAAEAAVTMQEASIEAEAAYSGVNLDAEASNLIEQQQAYQASARILTTARELFQTLIQSL